MAESGPCDECVSKQDVQFVMCTQTRGMEMAVEAHNQRVADLEASDHCLHACESENYWQRLGLRVCYAIGYASW